MESGLGYFVVFSSKSLVSMSPGSFVFDFYHIGVLKFAVEQHRKHERNEKTSYLYLEVY